MSGDSDGPALPVEFEFIRQKVAEAEGQQDIRRMRHQQHLANIYGMLDATSVEHLVTWRHLLNGMSRQNANYLEGMIVTLLRCVHNVCPSCGEPSHDEAGTTCPE